MSLKKVIDEIRKPFWKILGLVSTQPKHLKDFDWIKVGKHTYDMGINVFHETEQTQLIIGNFCSIANNTTFICEIGRHDGRNVTTSPLVDRLFSRNETFKIGSQLINRDIWDQENSASNGPIIIGNDVWLGTNSLILSGVTIGNGAIVLAGAVVTKNIPAYAIVGGIPAKIYRYRFPQETIEKLLNIAWWNWPDEKIKENISDFYGDVSDFINKFLPL